LLTIFSVVCVALTTAAGKAEDATSDDVTLDADIGKSREGSRTDDEAVQRFVTQCIQLLSNLNNRYT